MYLAFQPRGSFQGLPPIKDEVCVKWVREMLATGVHIVAIDRPAGLVGHTGLFPVNRQKCEMLVVVCPDYQNLGIGTELVRSCVALAGELGFERIWLPVDATNVRARHIYRKCGFEYVSNQQGLGLDMVCHVRPRHSCGQITPRRPCRSFRCQLCRLPLMRLAALPPYKQRQSRRFGERADQQAYFLSGPGIAIASHAPPRHRGNAQVPLHKPPIGCRQRIQLLDFGVHPRDNGAV